jgi:hypothetical protein
MKSLPICSAPLPPRLRKLKPDGICFSMPEESVYLLDFLRSSDFWEDSLELATSCKQEKASYRELVTAIRDHFPQYTVELLEFRPLIP